MDKAELIHQELEAVLTAAVAGIPIHRDRDLAPNAENESMPQAVLWSGDEELVIDQTATKPTWDRRWAVTPAIEIYLQDRQNPANLRAQANQIWGAFWQALRASGIQKLLAPSVFPEVRKSIDPVPKRRDLLVLQIEFVFTFDR